MDFGYQRHRIDGMDLWVHPVTGRVWPAIHGGATDDDGDGNGDEPRTFTQDEVDRTMGRVRAEARRAASNELAEQLGCTVEEARQRLDAAAATEANAKGEGERLLARAQADAAAAEQARTEAAADRLAAKVERALGKAQCVDPGRAVRLLDIADDADDDEIAEHVEALKGDLPALFTAASTEPDPTRIGGDRGRRRKAPAPKSFDDKGREWLTAAGIRTPDNAA